MLTTTLKDLDSQESCKRIRVSHDRDRVKMLVMVHVFDNRLTSIPYVVQHTLQSSPALHQILTVGRILLAGAVYVLSIPATATTAQERGTTPKRKVHCIHFLGAEFPMYG